MRAAATSAPAVSIVMPVRDAAATLDEALESLARQRYSDWELVVVNDQSRDATPAILDRWRARLPALRLVANRGEGLVAALQTGVAESRAPLLARMDADDVAHSDRLVRQVALLDARPDFALVTCAVAPHPAAPPGPGMAQYLRWLNGLNDHDAMARERFVESPIAHPTVVMRRAALDAVGGYRDRGWPEDYDLWLRLFAAGRRVGKVAAPLLQWRDAPARASRREGRYGAEAFLRCKAHHLALGPLAGEGGGGGRAFWIWGAGKYGRRLARALAREGCVTRGFIDIDPRKIGGAVRVGGTARGGGGREIAVRAPDDLPTAGEVVVLGAVGQKASDEPRRLIRAAVVRAGYREGIDFWATA